jgi:uncharacterized membrane protein
VLDLIAPPLEGGVGRGLLDEWPRYFAYLISFATVGAAWIAHTGITEHIDRADATFLRLNLLALLFIAVLPFPTRLMAEYMGESDAERLAVTIYGLNLLLISATLSLLWRYAAAEHLIKADRSDEMVREYSRRLTPSLGLYGAGIVLGLFAPRLAAFVYLLVAVFLLVPIRTMVRKKRTRGEGGSG